MTNLSHKHLHLHDVVSWNAVGAKLSSQMRNSVNMNFTSVSKARQVTLHVTAIYIHTQLTFSTQLNPPTLSP